MKQLIFALKRENKNNERKNVFTRCEFQDTLAPNVESQLSG